MNALIIPFYLFSRPLTSFARQTQTRLRQGYAAAGRTQKFCLRNLAEAKTSIASRYDQRLCLKGMMLLPGQSLSRRLVGSTCPVVARRAKSEAKKAKPQAFRRSRIAQAKKFLLSAYCLRVSAVKLFAYLSHSSGSNCSFH